MLPREKDSFWHLRAAHSHSVTRMDAHGETNERCSLANPKIERDRLATRAALEELIYLWRHTTAKASERKGQAGVVTLHLLVL